MKLFAALLSAVLTLPVLAQTAPSAPSAPGVIPAAEVAKLMPPSVFFSGQSATVQIRNSAGFRTTKGGLTLAGLVDTGGYSTSIRGKYQFYLITDTAIEIGGKKIGPGAYGAGFLDSGFLLMDLGGNDLHHAPTTNDAAMKRPRPLQIVASGSEYRLYLGRAYVTIQEAK